MATTSLSVLGTNGTAFFGVATEGTWAQFRALTEIKNLSIDGTSYEIVSNKLDTNVYEYDQSAFQFDVSSITNATSATFEINCTSTTGTPTARLVEGACTLPWTEANGLNQVDFGSPLSNQTSLALGINQILLTASGLSYINSSTTAQIYLLENRMMSDATAPSGDNRAAFNDLGLTLKVTTPDATSGMVNITVGAVKIVNGKVSL